MSETISINSTRPAQQFAGGAHLRFPAIDSPLPRKALASMERLIDWLKYYGETSQDVDDYFNNAYGKWSKSLYYRHPKLGTLAVAPLVFQEAFLPWTRKFFWPAKRFPLADAQFAMGFAYLFKATGREEYLDHSRKYLDALIETRCKGYKNFCWGYPFGWETVWGNFPEETPLITTTPYCYEAFEAMYEIDGNSRWLEIMHSVAEHALGDYKETEYAPGVWASSYSPIDKRKVVNANAYRAFLLTAASKRFGEEKYWTQAQRYLQFVLTVQQSDGSWLYSKDDWDHFIDHYHTCFVMKALTKIQRLTGHPGCAKAIEQGADYYFKNLIDERGLPKPFAKPPRLIIYKRELYDLAEAVNLALLLREQIPAFNGVLENCVNEITGPFQLESGALRTRKLLIGWNNVPMHRWGLSIAFRSLCLFLLQVKNGSIESN